MLNRYCEMNKLALGLERARVRDRELKSQEKTFDKHFKWSSNFGCHFIEIVSNETQR